MKKRPVYIFGDSYASAKNCKSHILHEYSWPRKLETFFDVTNFATVGLGPQDICIELHNLLSLRDKDEFKEITLIIIFPMIYRYNFSFYKERSHNVFGKISSAHSSDHYIITEFLKLYDQDKLNFILKFNEYYLDSPINYVIEELKYFSYFDNIASHFKQTLIWPVNPVSTNYQYRNIDIAPIDLDAIEMHEREGNVGFGKDNRMNHMSLINHTVMTEQLYNWIMYKTPIENKFYLE